MQDKTSVSKFLGTKSQYVKHLGTKNDDKEDTTNPQQELFISQLKKAYVNAIPVDEIEYDYVEQTILNLLKYNFSKNVYYIETLGNDIYIFEDDDYQYILCINTYKHLYTTTEEPLQDIQNIYTYLETLPQYISNYRSPSQPLPITNKQQVVGSFSNGSVVGDYISNKLNIPHITFNPTLFQTTAKVFKIKGDAYSMYSYNPTNEMTFEIVKDFEGLNPNATDIRNF